MFKHSLLSLALIVCAQVSHAQGRGSEDDAGPSRAGRDASMTDTGSADPRVQLQELVPLSMQRGRAIGAVRLLTLAAQDDLDETKASRLPTVSLGGVGAHIGSNVHGVEVPEGFQGRTTFSGSVPIYDSGRITKLTEWRSQLAEAARYSQSSAKEQSALQTVTLAVDRSRYVLQAQIYTPYVLKMACLVDALEIITKADRGRASELEQAQKSLQQADLSYEQTLSALRQTEIRMKRFVGDTLPPSAGMRAVLTRLPDLNQLQQDILLSADVTQVSAQAQAQPERSYAESVLAGQKSSASLVANGLTAAPAV